mgnify:CR=1 FL=1
MVLGDLRGVSQPTVSRTIKKVSYYIGELFHRFIKFPDADETQHSYLEFYRIAEFPGVVGCIDGTHVPIRNPGGEHPEIFRNRLGIFSFNCQVCIERNRIKNCLKYGPSSIICSLTAVIFTNDFLNPHIPHFDDLYKAYDL